jgi:hypothetical protein
VLHALWCSASSPSLEWCSTPGSVCLEPHDGPCPSPCPRSPAGGVSPSAADDTSIPVRLVQDLRARWQDATSHVREALAAAIGELMPSPHGPWHRTAHAQTDPPDTCGFVCDGRPTIRMPTDMRWARWTWVFDLPTPRAPILHWWVVTVDPPPWQKLRALRQQHAPWMTKAAWKRRYGYLSPQRFPDSVQEVRRLLQCNNRDDYHPALTIRERWLASNERETRATAAQILRTWLGKGRTPRALAHRWLPVLAILAAFEYATGETSRWTQAVAEIVSTHRSDTEIRAVLDRVVAAILLPDRVPDRDRARWVTTLSALVADSPRSDERRRMIAEVLHRMTHDPTVTAMIRDLLRVEPSLPTRVVHGTPFAPTSSKPTLRMECWTSSSGLYARIATPVSGSLTASPKGGEWP